MSSAMEVYFAASTGQTEIIKELHLDRNGLNDRGLANLLRGIAMGESN